MTSKPSLPFLARAARAAVLLSALQGVAAFAGSAEDYAEGAKHYAAGDVVAAMPLLRRAADAGHPAAQAAIGQLLEQADWGEEAIGYFRKSALQGNADGQFGLGAMLAIGRGAPKNLPEAHKWLLLAARQGHGLAITELALAYINGGLDIPDSARQSPEALQWIRAAAENGQLTAMETLSAAYRTGEYGLTPDTAQANQWADKVRKALNLKQGRRNKRSNDQ
jgi:TPR repeat protein